MCESTIMKILTASVAALIAIAWTCQSQASQVVITSPNQGETRASASIENRGLHWNARHQRLTAIITYSNKNYESPSVHPHDDTLAFALPGVRYNQAGNVFYATSKNGQRTPIAKFQPVLFGKKIQLLPGAAIVAQQFHGDVSVKLVTGEPSSTPHWIDIHQ
jgi:hypothetical protein